MLVVVISFEFNLCVFKIWKRNADLHKKEWLKISILVKGVVPEGARGAVASTSGSVSPPSEKNFVSGGEVLTENCVIIHRKISSILLFSPPSGKSWRHPCLGQNKNGEAMNENKILCQKFNNFNKIDCIKILENSGPNISAE